MYPNLNKTLLISKYCTPAGAETAVILGYSVQTRTNSGLAPIGSAEVRFETARFGENTKFRQARRSFIANVLTELSNR